MESQVAHVMAGVFPGKDFVDDSDRGDLEKYFAFEGYTVENQVYYLSVDL